MAELSHSKQYQISDISAILNSKDSLFLSQESIQVISKSHQYLQDKMADGTRVFYGINTGFGSLCNTVIQPEELQQLQVNLLRSHACGAGDEAPKDVVRCMLILKAIGLSKGYSGVQTVTVQRLLDLFNHDIIPVVYKQGSLGASGDLAPLAHMCLPIIGEGSVYFQSEKKEIQELSIDLKPIALGPKEGLALINGTQFMSGYGTICLIESQKLIEAASAIASLSAEAFSCRYDPFDSLVHAIRPHPGQINEAKNILKWIQGSAFALEKKEQVQDPYSFRCIPQVHGATRGVVDHVKNIFECEINSVSDNPNIFADEDLIISAGNFHGQPLAMALDYLALAMHELGNISERRTYLLVSGQRGLPPFLAPNAGLNSGFMIPQYTAASIVSKNKQLCNPSSADSIVSSNGQEDHVSMGANAAVKAYEIIENVKQVLAIELFTAAQAWEFRKPKTTSIALTNLYNSYREFVPFIKEDTYMYPHILKSKQFIDEYKF